LDMTHFAEEPGDNISKHNCFIGFVVTRRRRYASCVPEICFPLIEKAVSRFGVEKQDSGRAINEPSPV